MLSFVVFANLFSGISSLQAMQPSKPKVHHIAHAKLNIYYFNNRGIKRSAVQIMPGNGRAEFDQDSFVALQEQKGKTIFLQDPRAV